MSRKPEIYTIREPRRVLVASDGIFDPGHQESNSLLDEMRVGYFSGIDAKKIMERVEETGLRDNAAAIVWRKSTFWKPLEWLRSLRRT